MREHWLIHTVKHALDREEERDSIQLKLLITALIDNKIWVIQNIRLYDNG
jgi:hypothetical protein